MKKNLHDQCTVLGSNSRRWTVSSKSLISSQFFVILTAFLMSAFAATAQETNTPSAERSRPEHRKKNEQSVHYGGTPEFNEQFHQFKDLILRVSEKTNHLSSEELKLKIGSDFKQKMEEGCPNLSLWKVIVNPIDENYFKEISSKTDLIEVITAVELLSIVETKL